ncbi:MAG TPA: peroxiredoxin [bacterium]
MKPRSAADASSVLREGQAAPDFELETTGARSVRLSGFRGRWVALYFYPKDQTPGCTQEACDFRDASARFADAGAVVLGVSPDMPASHERFTSKYGLPFPLLCDPGAKTAEAYGLVKRKSLYGRFFMGVERTTLLIDPAGNIAKIFPKVRVRGHAGAVLDALRELIQH